MSALARLYFSSLVDLVLFTISPNSMRLKDRSIAMSELPRSERLDCLRVSLVANVDAFALGAEIYRLHSVVTSSGRR